MLATAKKQPLLHISPEVHKIPLLHTPPLLERISTPLLTTTLHNLLPTETIEMHRTKLSVPPTASNSSKTQASKLPMKLSNNFKFRDSQWFSPTAGASLNVKTQLTESRLAELCVYCRLHRLDYLLIQETHLPGFYDKKLKDIPTFKNWRIIGSGQGGNRKKAGVAILFSPKCIIEDYKVVESARIISAKIWLNGQPLVITSCYTPDMSYAESTRGSHWKTLDKYLSTIPKKYSRITAGDFNANIVPDEVELPGFGPYHPKSCYEKSNETNDNGEELLKLVAKQDLFLENTYFRNKRDCASWTHKNIGSWTRRYDFFLVDKLVHKYSTHCRSHPPPISSDHRILVLRHYLPTKKQRKEYSKKKKSKTPRPNIKLLNKNQFFFSTQLIKCKFYS